MTIRLIQRLVVTIVCFSLAAFDVQAAPAAGLKAGDEIEITVITSQDNLNGYTQRVVLPDDGAVTLPLVGRVAMLDKAPEQLVPDIEKAYRRIFAYAFVGLHRLPRKLVDTLASEVVYVSGQVKAGGAISPPQAGKRLSLVDAIGRAGGLTDVADAEHIAIYRAGGGLETIDFDKALQDGRAGRIALQPGDMVRVPGNWMSAINVYSPIIQIVSLVGGGILFISGLILNGQAVGRQAPASP